MSEIDYNQTVFTLLKPPNFGRRILTTRYKLTDYPYPQNTGILLSAVLRSHFNSKEEQEKYTEFYMSQLKLHQNSE